MFLSMNTAKGQDSLFMPCKELTAGSQTATFTKDALMFKPSWPLAYFSHADLTANPK